MRGCAGRLPQAKPFPTGEWQPAPSFWRALPAAAMPRWHRSARWEQVSGRLYDLRVQLQITHEQGPAWENFRGRFLDMATAGSPGTSLLWRSAACGA